MINQTPPVQIQTPPIPQTGGVPTTPEVITGGNADGQLDSNFNAEQLAVGIAVELEHTKDINVAKEIAKDHLKEDADYYKKLAKIDSDAANAQGGLPANGVPNGQPPIPAIEVPITPTPDPVPMSIFGNDIFLLIFGV